MPFLGQDWRSPGQSWVKTEEGWKKTTADDKNNNVSVERLVVKLNSEMCHFLPTMFLVLTSLPIVVLAPKDKGRLK